METEIRREKELIKRKEQVNNCINLSFSSSSSSSNSVFDLDFMSIGSILKALSVCNNYNLRILALSDVAFQNSDLECLTLFLSLVSFQIHGRNCNLSDHGLIHLSSCSSLCHLTINECLHITAHGLIHLPEQCNDITFQLCPYINDGAIYKLIQKQTRLHTLNIDQCPVTDQGISFLVEAKNLRSLSIIKPIRKKINPNNNNTSVTGILANLPLTTIPITTHSISSSFPTSDASILPLLTTPSIIAPLPIPCLPLPVYNPLITDDSLHYISLIPSLTALQLKNCDDLTGRGLLWHLRPSKMIQLAKLRIDFCEDNIPLAILRNLTQINKLIYNSKIIRWDQLNTIESYIKSPTLYCNHCNECNAKLISQRINNNNNNQQQRNLWFCHSCIIRFHKNHRISKFPIELNSSLIRDYNKK